MSSQSVTYWLGSREHLPLTVDDTSTSPATPATDYQVAVVRSPALYTETDWQPNEVYAGKHGAWIDSTPRQLEAGSYRVWARVGQGEPNERAVVLLGWVYIIGR